MIVRILLNVALIVGLGGLFAGPALAGGVAGPDPDCVWGVVRDIGGSAKFFFDEEADGSSDASFVFGQFGSDFLVGDWDGDGIDTIAIRETRATDRGKFFFDNDGDPSPENSFVLGEDTAEPISGDWDGDGTDEVGIRRNIGGRGKFFLDNDGAVGHETSFVFGAFTEIAVVGDWDGSDTDNIGIVRVVGADNRLRWFMANDAGGSTGFVDFGFDGDIPIVGDWDDDGDDDIGVIDEQPSGTFRFRLDSDMDGTADFNFAFGNSANDAPLVCEFSDANTEVGIARVQAAQTRLLFQTSPALDGVVGQSQPFGDDTDTPFVGRFNGLSAVGE
ncbi:MAG: hypothetical protein NXI30_13650 [bacterium]|nr:hypothetical protein [bacterium]